MPKEHDYWFPAKRYGIGWGPPARWEGWAVLLGYMALVLTVALAFPPEATPRDFMVGMASLTIALILVCWWKGEPTRWRWGP